MKQLKPFNLEQALAGAPIVTRNGCPIVELKYLQTSSKLAVVRKEPDDKLISYFVPCDGKLGDTIDYATDLFMAPTKKEGWVNIYNPSSKNLNGVSWFAYNSREEAIANQASGYIATAKIKWEE